MRAKLKRGSRRLGVRWRGWSVVAQSFCTGEEEWKAWLGFGRGWRGGWGDREGPGWRLKGGAWDLGMLAADLETSEKRGEDGSARGKRTEPLLRVIPGSGEEASRREGLR